MTKRKYKHLSEQERVEITYLLSKNYSLRDIAKALGRGLGTISEEITRNKTKGAYDPRRAQIKTKNRRANSKYQGMKIRNDSELESYVRAKLRSDWSPEQIAGRLKKTDTHLTYASFRVIYKYVKSVWGVELRQCLRYQGKSKNKQKRASKEKLANRRFIDERPQITLERGRFGDWEGDFVVSGKEGKGILLVLYERRSRYVLIRKLMSQKTRVVNQAIRGMIQNLAALRSLTLDNDISFAKHEKLSEMIGIPIFFCHPYHSWEKGGVENTNLLIRQYVPKGADISRFNDERIKEIEVKLNTRPRKCLGFKTPLEVMLKNKQFKELPLFINSERKQACSA